MLNSPYLDNRFPFIQRNPFWGGVEGVLRKWATLDLAKYGYKLDMKVEKCKNFVIFWLTAGTYCRNLAFFFFFFFPFGNLAN